MTLLYHRSTSAINTKVETKRGVVTLYGKASNAAEKDLAGNALASNQVTMYGPLPRVLPQTPPRPR